VTALDLGLADARLAESPQTLQPSSRPRLSITALASRAGTVFLPDALGVQAGVGLRGQRAHAMSWPGPISGQPEA